MMYYYGNSWGMPHMYGFGFLGIIFWVFVIYVLVMTLKNSGFSHGKHHKEEKKPIDILKERYAKGEITKHEFETMKKDLE